MARAEPSGDMVAIRGKVTKPKSRFKNSRSRVFITSISIAIFSHTAFLSTIYLILHYDLVAVTRYETHAPQAKEAGLMDAGRCDVMTSPVELLPVTVLE